MIEYVCVTAIPNAKAIAKKQKKTASCRLLLMPSGGFFVSSPLIIHSGESDPITLLEPRRRQVQELPQVPLLELRRQPVLLLVLRPLAVLEHLQRPVVLVQQQFVELLLVLRLQNIHQLRIRSCCSLLNCKKWFRRKKIHKSCHMMACRLADSCRRQVHKSCYSWRHMVCCRLTRMSVQEHSLWYMKKRMVGSC